MSINNEVIPERYVNFCKQVAKLARDLGAQSCSVSVNPGFGDREWSDQVNGVWTSGRHGDSANGLVVSAKVTVRTTVNIPEMKTDG